MSADRCVRKIADTTIEAYRSLALTNSSGKADGDVVIMGDTKCDLCTYTCKVVAKFDKGKLISITKHQTGKCAKD